MGRLISAGHTTSCLPGALPFFFFFCQGKAGGGQCHQHVSHFTGLSLHGFISFPLSRWTLLLFLPWRYTPNKMVQTHTKTGIQKDKNLIYSPLPSILSIIILFSPLPWLLPLQVWSSWYLSIFEKRCFGVRSIFIHIYIYTYTHIFLYIYIHRHLFLCICINKYIRTERERGRHRIWLTIIPDWAIINSAGLFLIFTSLTEIWMWPIMYRLTNQRTSRLIFYGYRIICTP